MILADTSSERLKRRIFQRKGAKNAKDSFQMINGLNISGGKKRIVITRISLSLFAFFAFFAPLR